MDKINLSTLLSKIATPERFGGYIALGLMVFIYHVFLDVEATERHFHFSILLFVLVYLLHNTLVATFRHKTKWNFVLISLTIDCTLFLTALWFVDFNVILSMFAVVCIFFIAFMHQKKRSHVFISFVIFILVLLACQNILPFAEDVKVFNTVGFTLYFALLTTFLFFVGYYHLERYRKLEEQNNSLQKQLSEYMDFCQQISRYTPPQLWQSIMRGEYSARIEYKRKKMTIFFSDIQGFTELSEKLIAEDLAYLLNDYMFHMTQIVQQYNGTIDKYMGDGLLVFFGDIDSQGVEKDARNCVDMAIAMRQQMKILRERWKKMGHPELHIRMGISTGYCHVGNYGSEERMSYTIVGREVNLASRIQSSASVDEILLSDSTYQIVSSEFLCIEKHAVQLKGIAQPIRTWQVVERYHGSSSRHNPHHWFEFEYKGFQLILDLNEVENMQYDVLITTLEEMVARIRLQQRLTNQNGIVELRKEDKIIVPPRQSQ